MPTPRDEMLDRMQERALQIVPEGQPIIPDGPTATSEDMQDFKRMSIALGFEVKFGQVAAVTRPGSRTVSVTSKCTVGILTDEYLHVWNNFGDRRGTYLSEAMAEEHKGLGSTLRLSGSSNDRRFHQLELLNYVLCLRRSGEAIPTFVWRTFNVLPRVKKADAGA
jgi:hypothetical protein